MSNPIKSQCDNYWFSHKRVIEEALGIAARTDDLGPFREILNRRFEDGARWAMQETTRLNPYVSQFIEMLILLGVFDNANSQELDASAEPSDGPRANADSGMSDMFPTLPVSPTDSRNDADLMRRLFDAEIENGDVI